MNAPDLNTRNLRHLRELRLWHWQMVLRYRGYERRAETQRSPQWVINSHSKIANFHLGAVQALNDLFPIGDTAEKDNDGI